MLLRVHAHLLVTCLFVSIISFADNKTATITVTATVISACEAGASSGSGISFGTLDFGTVVNLNTPVTAVGQTNSGAIRIKCTNNTPYVIYLDTGLHSQNTAMRYLSNGTAQVGYNLYTNATRTTVWDNVTGFSGVSNGQEVWIPIYGVVFQQATTPVGTYTDKVNVTIAY